VPPAWSGRDVVGRDVPRDVVARLVAGEVGGEDGPGLGEGALGVELVVVEHVAVGRDDGAHVLGALHAALDLEGVHSRLHELRHAVDELEVVGREVVAVRPLGRVEAAAGLGAEAAVGALSPEVAREEAEARGAHAEGPVDEDLELEVGGLGDLANLLEGELAGEDGAVEAVAREEVGPPGRGDVHLRGAVEPELGKVLLDDVHEAEVLDDEAVGPHPVQVLEELVHAVGLALLEDRVDGYVDLLRVLAAVLDGGLELAEGEVRAPHAGIEALQAEIDGVGALAYGGVEGLGVARGGEQFNGRHENHYTAFSQSC